MSVLVTGVNLSMYIGVFVYLFSILIIVMYSKNAMSDLLDYSPQAVRPWPGLVFIGVNNFSASSQKLPQRFCWNLVWSLPRKKDHFFSLHNDLIILSSAILSFCRKWKIANVLLFEVFQNYLLFCLVKWVSDIPETS